MQTHQDLLEAEEELEDIQAFDAALASQEKTMPLADAIREIEANRGDRISS